MEHRLEHRCKLVGVVGVVVGGRGGGQWCGRGEYVVVGMVVLALEPLVVVELEPKHDQHDAE